MHVCYEILLLTCKFSVGKIASVGKFCHSMWTALYLSIHALHWHIVGTLGDDSFCCQSRSIVQRRLDPGGSLPVTAQCIFCLADRLCSHALWVWDQAVFSLGMRPNISAIFGYTWPCYIISNIQSGRTKYCSYIWYQCHSKFYGL